MKHFNQPLLLSSVLGAFALTGCVSSSTPMPVRMAEIKGTALPSLPPLLPGATAARNAPAALAPLAVPAAVRDMDGDNAATRTFYATVTDVLPNGHLVVSREKLINASQSMDLLRFTATLDPHKPASDNVSPAGALASMRLESSEGELPAAGLTGVFASADAH